MSKSRDRIEELELANAMLCQALRRIVLLDDDAHPGLFTWQEARAEAHAQAKRLLVEVES